MYVVVLLCVTSTNITYFISQCYNFYFQLSNTFKILKMRKSLHIIFTQIFFISFALSSFLMFQVSFKYNFPSGRITYFSNLFKVALLVINYLSFPLSENTLLSPSLILTILSVFNSGEPPFWLQCLS